MLGLATADTSATIRLLQPVSCCQLGLVVYPLHPLPVPPLALLAEPHTLSTHPRELPLDWARLVPPTEVT